MNAKRWLQGIGLALLVWLILLAGPRQLWAALIQADLRWLLWAWVLNLPQLAIKAYRWHRMLRWQGIEFGFRRALLAYFGALLVGFITPGRLGEAAKAITLKYEAGVPLARGLSSVVLDRLFDLYLLLALGTLGLVRFAVIGTRLSWGTFAVGGLILLAPLALLHPRIVRGMGDWLARRLGPTRGAGVREKAGQFASGLASLTLSRVMQCAALTIASYSIFFYQCFCCAWALHFTVAARDLVLLQAATNFIAFLPLAPYGLGTREASLVWFLARVQPPVARELAVAYGLVILLVFFIGGSVIGAACWLWAPIGLQRAWGDLRARRQSQP